MPQEDISCSLLLSLSPSFLPHAPSSDIHLLTVPGTTHWLWAETSKFWAKQKAEVYHNPVGFLFLCPHARKAPPSEQGTCHCFWEVLLQRSRCLLQLLPTNFSITTLNHSNHSPSLRRLLLFLVLSHLTWQPCLLASWDGSALKACGEVCVGGSYSLVHQWIFKGTANIKQAFNTCSLW